MAIFFSFMLIFSPCDVVPGSLKYAAGAMSIIANSGERYLPFYQGHTAGIGLYRPGDERGPASDRLARREGARLCRMHKAWWGTKSVRIA